MIYQTTMKLVIGSEYKTNFSHIELNWTQTTFKLSEIGFWPLINTEYYMLRQWIHDLERNFLDIFIRQSN